MASNNVPKRVHFSKVKEAREAFQARAVELQDLYFRAIKLGLDTGQIEHALKSIQWGLEHMGRENGVGVVDSSVNTKTVDVGPKGPQIQIGIALGGIKPKALPSDTTVIDVLPDVTEEPCLPQPLNAVSPQIPTTTSQPEPQTAPTVNEPPSS